MIEHRSCSRCGSPDCYLDVLEQQLAKRPTAPNDWKEFMRRRIVIAASFCELNAKRST